ncbi:hypothetical protein F5X99DRAFT_422334 [Biscogniauxia marginata]|nr:hypothetical protein F5X99DRAFT_422334 [Biscogniauxia marginata]
MTDTKLPLSFSLTAGHPHIITGLSPAGAAAKPRSLPPPPPYLYETPLPPVTTGTSELYIHRTAAAVARASLTDPLNILFLSEMPYFSSSTSTPLTPTTIYRPLYSSAASRLRAKLARGAFVAEAGGFAAVACWEPLSLRDAEPRCGADFDVGVGLSGDKRGGRPAFAAFAEQVRVLKRLHVDPVSPRGRSWHVCLTARDPAREYVAGAVRAVLVPFMRRVTGEEDGDGLEEWERGPVWLEAGNETARDVYAHFGFRVVHIIEVMGIRTYGMIYTGNLEKGGGMK